ncbi:excitatory amino acid transporter 1 isoform X2 [Cryptotermes secundus]|uniref:excitatory amino acid transporter 1 isoform X2 n=1 Tax=Cryptotermes secundus TaxID=105785 RepID=UPI001454E04B|nr:excitatory amino acid transporter 1 isoform X2 [Cryptotermes secundus]
MKSPLSEELPSPLESRRSNRRNMANTARKRIKSFLRGNLLTLLTVIGVFGGAILGVILRQTREDKWTEREIMYVSYFGDIFLQMLKSLILPLIVASIISAIGGLDLSLSGKIGARAIVYYFCTTVSAVVLGMILVSVIHPGRGDASEISKSGTSRNVTTVDTLLDLVRNMFPPNLVQACIAQYQTVLTPDESITAMNYTMLDWKISHRFVTGTNILGLVVFATVLGITLAKMAEKGKPLLIFFETLGGAMLIITYWVIWISPIGIFFLVAAKVLEMESFEVIVGQLGMYFTTVLLGLFIHGFVVIPLYYSICTRKLPFRFIVNMSQALFTAFGTGSSNATLPISMSCLEEKNEVDPRVVRFVMPIGATINMDGTALYEAVAAIFISQVRNMTLSIGQLLAMSITATAASIGAAGIPQAGLVTMVMVLDTVGLPPEDVTLIIAVDWLLDRFRTTINVLGDSIGAGIVDHLSKSELLKLGQPNPDTDKVGSQNGEVNAEEAEWHTTAM